MVEIRRERKDRDKQRKSVSGEHPTGAYCGPVHLSMLTQIYTKINAQMFTQVFAHPLQGDARATDCLQEDARKYANMKY